MEMETFVERPLLMDAITDLNSELTLLTGFIAGLQPHEKENVQLAKAEHYLKDLNSFYEEKCMPVVLSMLASLKRISDGGAILILPWYSTAALSR